MPQAETGYAAIRRLYQELAHARDHNMPFSDIWERYRNVVLSSPQPYHLRWVMRWLEKAKAGRDIQEVCILDHGCGGGGTLLYMLALGYTGIHGVDVIGASCEKWNRLLYEVCGIKEKRFFVYDGSSLPFNRDKFDFIFSEEVLEHVAPDVFESYYSEEWRTLKPTGLAFHQVPHRLVPYESHLQAWFLHWLPRRAAGHIYRIFGYNADFFVNHLFLRWPWEHNRQLRKYFARVEDVTAHRLGETIDFEYYDGAVSLRRFIARLTALPGLGRFMRLILRWFVMLQTVAWKGHPL